MASMTLDKLERRLAQYFNDADDPSIAAAWLFGSTARGAARAGSDVDIAVLLSRDPAPTIDGLRLDLRDSLEGIVGRNVDLIVLNNAPVDLIHRVLRDGRLLFESDPSVRVRFEVRARNEYFDLLPILERYRRSASTGV
jgi:predicted nucleotidyltransferase